MVYTYNKYTPLCLIKCKTGAPIIPYLRLFPLFISSGVNVCWSGVKTCWAAYLGLGRRVRFPSIIWDSSRFEEGILLLGLFMISSGATPVSGRDWEFSSEFCWEICWEISGSGVSAGVINWRGWSTFFTPPTEWDFSTGSSSARLRIGRVNHSSWSLSTCWNAGWGSREINSTKFNFSASVIWVLLLVSIEKFRLIEK